MKKPNFHEMFNRAVKKGRPPVPGGRRVQAYLDPPTLKAARKLGGGNVSKGIRLALKKSKLIQRLEELLGE